MENLNFIKEILRIGCNREKNLNLKRRWTLMEKTFKPLDLSEENVTLKKFHTGKEWR